METQFVEKYMPSSFDGVVGQTKLVNRMKRWIADKKIPNCCFVGPAGIGKTTLANVFAREYFGENYQSNFVVFDASVDRGIDTVRGKIKSAAKSKNLLDEPKIIFLDEADSITGDAQAALRRTMEMYSDNCRFILSCNYPHKLIEPILSRCPEIQFEPVTADEIRPKLNYIAEKEGFKISEKAINKIVEVFSGDMRKILNTLEMVSSEIKDIKVEHVAKTIDPDYGDKILSAVLDDDIPHARELLMTLLVTNQGKQKEILKVLYDGAGKLNFGTKEDNLAKSAKLKVYIAEIEMRLTHGGTSPLIQLDSILMYTIGLKFMPLKCRG